MRIYDYMKGILGAMGVGEDVGVPEPSWRIEEYLKAIYDKLKEGSGSLPSVTSSDNGKVLAVKDGAWAAEHRHELKAYEIQHIPVSFDGTSFVTTITPKDVEDGFTYNGVAQPSFDGSSLTVMDIYIAGSKVGTVDLPIYEYGGDGPMFKSFPANLDSLVFPGKVGLVYFSTSSNTTPYVINMVTWDKGGKFIVTLTPTSPDYSGTMDKTVAEINAAYEAGQEIVFKLQTSASDYIEVPIQLVGHSTTLAYPSFETSVVQGGNNIQVFAYTSVTDDGTSQTYHTVVYSLTPAS